MQRFYFENLEETDDSITVKNPELLNQLNKVLRVKIGDELCFFNSKDPVDFIYKIISIDRREVYLEKTGYIEKDNEIDFNLNIISALPNKISKIEIILQKATEIGVTNFMFFRSKRSQKLNLSENKIERLKKIIIEASEQSNRNIVPELIIFDDICLGDIENSQNILLHTEDKESKSIKDLKLDYSKNINLFTGPEGGFTDEEIEIFSKSGFIKIHLGDRTLRAETAPLVSSFFIIQNK